ncbi:DHHA1 domain-containing protein [Candidatus Poseidoniaceae archaeon]|nr:DHHA1 domain-containing protein [Euryarchaeota archaeon]MDA9166408.1 DHHA1 domain-containing protein [Candidatus Poseidoniaceae archaeon]
MNADEQHAELESFHDWLMDACSIGAVPIVTGKNGDMDTIGSAVALSAAHPNLMACGLHLGRTAKRMVESLQAPFRKLSEHQTVWPKNIGGIIVVDAAAAGQVGVSLPEGIPICVLDHHATCDWELDKGDLLLQWDVRATTQIVDAYLRLHAPQTRSVVVRKMLLAGLLTDTARFRHADKGAFQTAVDLLAGDDIDYASFVESVESESTSPSERGSLLRGLERATSIDSGAWNIVHTYSGTLEGRLASLLIGTGAEIALVSRFRDGVTRLTARASRHTTQRGIHLGNLMSKVAEQIGGEGGGHAGAAGWSGKTDRIAAESSFITQVALITRSDE